MTKKAILRKRFVLATAGLSMTIALQVFAQSEARGPHHGMPPELRAQLSSDQIAQLEAATNFEQEKALLDSWGLQMPRPPHGERHRPPPETGQQQSMNGQQ